MTSAQWWDIGLACWGVAMIIGAVGYIARQFPNPKEKQ